MISFCRLQSMLLLLELPVAGVQLPPRGGIEHSATAAAAPALLTSKRQRLLPPLLLPLCRCVW
jgi:hypothetical protein